MKIENEERAWSVISQIKSKEKALKLIEEDLISNNEYKHISILFHNNRMLDLPKLSKQRFISLLKFYKEQLLKEKEELEKELETL